MMSTRFQKLSQIVNSMIFRVGFVMLGAGSLLWFLLRVIPKPSRAVYPCMKIAFPIASGFVTWIVGLFTTIALFRNGRKRIQSSRLVTGILLILCAVFAAFVTFLKPAGRTFATSMDAPDPYGALNPVGVAKGIHPGRVVWVHNPEATNENCDPQKTRERYYLDENNDQGVIDQMLSKALLELTGESTEEAAWDGVFRYFNQEHGKGDAGYQNTETIFIKINAVHAWTVSSSGSGTPINVDTSPHAVLSMLQQLVNFAGVPQENIYIGDPYTHIFTHCYDKWRADFPNIHYMDKNGLDGREKYTESKNYIMKFSDRGQVIDEKEDKFFTVMEEADYLLNIPAMKGHRWGGVTLFAKNFFGTNTRSGAGHMHDGLHRIDYEEPLRGEYGMYRVFVDLMGHENLGGKTLIYFMDALWSCSYEHEPPVKFQMAPFSDDWTSSILLSQDPVAISSVCLDILGAEFPKVESEEPGNYWYANFPACDDYLHQAADSKNWPEGIVYDPEEDGTPVQSLGVHEHWNNETDMDYTRNLGSADGIELIKVFQATAVKPSPHNTNPTSYALTQNYPNPFNPSTQISFDLKKHAHVSLTVYNIRGEFVQNLVDQPLSSGSYQIHWHGRDAQGNPVPSGSYIYRIYFKSGDFEQALSRKMMLLM